MKRYEKHKDSRVEWLGFIPEHWRALKLKFIGDAMIGVTYTPEDLVDENEGILVLRSSNIQNGKLSLEDNVYINKSINERLFVQLNDILLCSRNGSRDLIGKNILIDERSMGMTFGAFMTVYRTEYSKFLYYFFNSQIFSAQSSLFLSSTINQLTLGVLRDMFVALPPQGEQEKIVSFLNYQTSVIDELIGRKEKLIEKLKEKRQAVINEAVTKGLDTNAKMKDSGIEWLGAIPENWKLLRVKYLLADTENALKTGPFGSELKSADMTENGDYSIYTQRNVLDNEFTAFKDYVDDKKAATLKGFEVRDNDILITTRGTIGRAAIVPEGSTKGYLHPCLIALRLNEQLVLPSWALTYMNESSYFLRNVLFESNSTTIEVIYGGTLRNVLIPVPPISEQRKILEFVENKLSNYKALEVKIGLQLIALKEYRQSLISEAVTGKIDVRNWEPPSKN